MQPKNYIAMGIENTNALGINSVEPLNVTMRFQKIKKNKNKQYLAPSE
jgi:hypothetical protein